MASCYSFGNEFPRDALPSTVFTRVVSRIRMFGRTFAVLVGSTSFDSFEPFFLSRTAISSHSHWEIHFQKPKR